MFPNPEAMKAETRPSTHVCDACGHEANGYSKTDLKAEGWCWLNYGDEDDKRHFVLCDGCMDFYGPRWKEIAGLNEAMAA